MDKKAVEQAQAALDECSSLITAMEAVTNLNALKTIWSNFLISANRIYTKLEQGAKTNGKSIAWFGRKKSERKNDPLLSYIHHARNANEHTLAEITDKQPPSVSLGLGPGSWSISAMTDAQGNVNASITAMGGQIEGVSKFWEVTPGRVRMVKVVDRGVEYDPPLDGLSNEIPVLCSILHSPNITLLQALAYDGPLQERRLSWRRRILLPHCGRNAARYLGGSSVWRRNCVSGGWN